MKKLPFIFIFMLIFCGCMCAQPTCPALSVTGPSGITAPSEPITFTAVVEAGGQALTYKWTVSSGKIIEGEGTPVINVTKEEYGSNTTATIEINGLPEGCQKVASMTVQHPWCPAPVLIEILPAPFTVRYKQRFENIVQKLRDDPTSRLVIVLYFDSARRQAVGRQTILKYLRLPVGDRITFLETTAGGGSEFANVWIVPAGASDPVP